MQGSSCDPQDDGAMRKVFRFHTDETINKKVIYMIYFETKYVPYSLSIAYFPQAIQLILFEPLTPVELIENPDLVKLIMSTSIPLGT